MRFLITYLMTAEIFLALLPPVLAIALLSGRLQLAEGVVLSTIMGLLLWLVHRSLLLLADGMNPAKDGGEIRQALGVARDAKGREVHRPVLWRDWQGGVSYGLIFALTASALLSFLRMLDIMSQRWAFGPLFVSYDGSEGYLLAPLLIVLTLVLAGIVIAFRRPRNPRK